MWKGWKLCGSVVRMVFQNAGGKRNGLDLIIIFVRSPDSVIPWWRKLATPWIHTSSQFWRIPLIFPSTYHILGKEYSANPEKHIKMRLRDFSNHTTSPPHKNSWTFVYISLTLIKHWTQYMSVLHLQKKIWKGHFSRNILSLCTCTIVGVFLSYIVTKNIVIIRVFIEVYLFFVNFYWRRRKGNIPECLSNRLLEFHHTLEICKRYLRMYTSQPHHPNISKFLLGVCHKKNWSSEAQEGHHSNRLDQNTYENQFS